MESIKALRKICQASEQKRTQHILSIRFFRLFSIYLTWLLLHTRITPNQITILGTSICVLSPFLFILNDPLWNIVAVALYILGYVLDYCDGEVARYRKTAGKAGLWYVEPASHDIQYGLFFIPLGFAAYQIDPSIWMIVLGFSASLSKLLTRALESRFQFLKLLRLQYLGQLEKPKEKPSTSAPIDYMRLDAKIYEIVFKSPAFTWVLIFSGLTQRFDLFLWFYGTTLPLIFLLFLVITHFKIQPSLKA